MIKLNQRMVVFEKFPNNETKLNTSSVILNKYLRDKDNEAEIIEFKYEDDSSLIELLILKSYLDQMFVDNVELMIYYMPYSRMDRVERNSAFTLKYIGNFINNMNFDKVLVIEPHSDVTMAVLNNSVESNITNDLLEIVKDDVGFTLDDYLFYPDAGAQKRYKTKSNYLVGHKVRDFDSGKIVSFEVVGNAENTKGKKVIIVDDLSSYGGTFVESSIELKKLGFSEVYLLIAHAENSIFKGELFNHVDKIFTTNSILDVSLGTEEQLEKLKVYEI